MPNFIVALGISTPASAGAGMKRSAARANCGSARAATVAAANRKCFRRFTIGQLGGRMLRIWSLQRGYTHSGVWGTRVEAISVPNNNVMITLTNIDIVNARCKIGGLHAACKTGTAACGAQFMCEDP